MDAVEAAAVRLARLRERLPVEVGAALEAAERDRCPDPADFGLPPDDLGFAPRELGFAVVSGAEIDRPQGRDGTLFSVVAVDEQGREVVLEAMVSRTDLDTVGRDDPGAFVVEQMRFEEGRIRRDEGDRLVVLCGRESPIEL